MTTFISQKPERRRVQKTCPEISITDQESARELSMASIKKKLEAGHPIYNFANDLFYDLKPPRFTNLQDALNFQQHVNSLFHSLPVEIRKGMDNDLKNFDAYLADPKNEALLLKHGLLQQKDSTNTDIVKSIKVLSESLSKPLPNPSPDNQK